MCKSSLRGRGLTSEDTCAEVGHTRVPTCTVCEVCLHGGHARGNLRMATGGACLFSSSVLTLNSPKLKGHFVQLVEELDTESTAGHACCPCEAQHRVGAITSHLPRVLMHIGVPILL